MNWHGLLAAREASPIRIGLIGAGKFATMFLAQARHTPGLHVAAVCDLDPDRARRNLRAAGWDQSDLLARTPRAALAEQRTCLGTDPNPLIEEPGIDVVVEATGDAVAGVRHALACIEAGRHVVMVNVEADVLAGPVLADKAKQVEVVYSLAYGDQPALIVELVDWARASGFEVTCAGKGTKYLPGYHASTPDTVWAHYGLSPERARAGGMNPKMFNSFLDGTKSAIEMAAVANATGLKPPAGGLAFHPCETTALARTMIPAAADGVLEASGMVEVIASGDRDGNELERNLRWGVYVTFEARSDYAAACFAEYGLQIDASGRYAALYRPYHLIGLELGISIASVALRREPTGVPREFGADVVAIAKRDLHAGEVLDGEGGYTVWGKLSPWGAAIASGGFPIGLAKDVLLLRDVAAGAPVTWADVRPDETCEVVGLRRRLSAGLQTASS